MSAQRLILRPKPICLSPSLVTKSSQSYSCQNSPERSDFDELPILSRAKSYNSPSNSSTMSYSVLENFMNIPLRKENCNLEEMLKIQEELSYRCVNRKLYQEKQDVPIRPSNPMVKDNLWSSSDVNSCSTEEDYENDKDIITKTKSVTNFFESV